MRFRKCMVVLILLGIFLGGLGTGIGFAEYSGLEYEGHVELAGEEKKTQRLIWEVDAGEYEQLHPYFYWDDYDVEVTEDRTVPRDEVWFDITCSEAFGEAELGPTEEYQHTGNGTWKEAVVNVCQHGSMGFEEQMRMAVSVRDQFLEELKEGKFSTYDFRSYSEIKIRIHPNNYEKLELW